MLLYRCFLQIVYGLTGSWCWAVTCNNEQVNVKIIEMGFDPISDQIHIYMLFEIALRGGNAHCHAHQPNHSFSADVSRESDSFFRKEVCLKSYAILIFIPTRNRTAYYFLVVIRARHVTTCPNQRLQRLILHIISFPSIQITSLFCMSSSHPLIPSCCHHSCLSLLP